MHRAWWRWYLLGGALVVAAHFAVHGAAQAHVYEAVSLSSAAAVLVGVRRHRPERPGGWILVAGGLASLALGDIVWDYFQYVRHIPLPSPSIADAFYISGYPLLLLGLVILITRRTPNDRQGLVDAGMVSAAAGLLIWIIAIHHYEVGSARSLAGLVALLYPIMDVLLVAVLARMLLTSRQRRAAYWFLVLGMMALLFSDLTYAVLLGKASQAGSPWALGWLASYILVGTAGLHPSMSRAFAGTPSTSATPLSRPRFRLLGAVALIPFILAGGIVALGGSPDYPELVIGAAVLLVLVLIRMGGLVAVVEDRTRQLVRQRERFRSLVQNSSDVVSVVDAHLRVMYQSPAAERVFGLPPGGLIGQSLASVLHPDDVATMRELWIEIRRAPGAHGTFVCRVRAGDGSWRHAESTATNLLGDENVQGVVLNSRDVTERIELERQLTHRAFHDPLTDVANRALFFDRIERAAARARREHAPLAIMYLDLDGFKSINDVLGHEAGDDVIRQFAMRLTGCIRESDSVGRLGGDEFGILLEGIDGPSGPARLAERLLRTISAPIVIAGQEVALSTSIGIAVSWNGSEGAGDLVRHADQAMYRAKASGRGAYEVSTTGPWPTHPGHRLEGARAG